MRTVIGKQQQNKHKHENSDW